ncbi:hypothetical protein BDN70DRAFT_901692 [Pholiota conissans]|uniref:Secreted protein n=1 Tax=Pholiota conissans TaxID=109636 RepID=A0A9P6CSX0_9AGAR|nr:hypothetical protein BDN70DRAFT_901692 [Pholiota conissans]
MFAPSFALMTWPFLSFTSALLLKLLVAAWLKSARVKAPHGILMGFFPQHRKCITYKPCRRENAHRALRSPKQQKDFRIKCYSTPEFRANSLKDEIVSALRGWIIEGVARE